MFFEEGAEEQAEVLDEVLLVVLPVGVGHSDVSVQRQHLTTGQNITFIYLHSISSRLLIASVVGFV